MKIAVVLNDAGSANVILSYLQDFENTFDILASGPALDLLERAEIQYRLITFDEICNLQYDVILLGLSFPSDIDLRVTQALQESDSLLVTFLDHWSFSETDFIFQSKLLLPDMFVVTDSDAFTRAVQHFPGTSVVQIENSYLSDSLERFLSLPQKHISQSSILYLAEPLSVEKNSNLANLFGSYSSQDLEFKVFEYMQSCIKLFAPQCTQIVIRPHPVQSKTYFGTEYLAGNYKVSISEEPSLVEDIRAAEVVVGIHTMALVVARHLGKDSYTCLPPGSGDCAIKGIDIKYLRDL
ncbi:hypothetical protein MCERE155_00039 [Candidatus Nanopelagicaceae bacterium]